MSGFVLLMQTVGMFLPVTVVVCVLAVAAMRSRRGGAS